MSKRATTSDALVIQPKNGITPDIIDKMHGLPFAIDIPDSISEEEAITLAKGIEALKIRVSWYRMDVVSRLSELGFDYVVDQYIKAETEYEYTRQSKMSSLAREYPEEMRMRYCDLRQGRYLTFTHFEQVYPCRHFQNNDGKRLDHHLLDIALNNDLSTRDTGRLRAWLFNFRDKIEQPIALINWITEKPPEFQTLLANLADEYFNGEAIAATPSASSPQWAPIARNVNIHAHWQDVRALRLDEIAQDQLHALGLTADSNDMVTLQVTLIRYEETDKDHDAP